MTTVLPRGGAEGVYFATLFALEAAGLGDF